MAIYTHTGPIHYEATSIHMIVTDAPRAALNISEDWFEVDAQEVADIEELTGAEYAEVEGWVKLFVERGPNMERIEKWGRL